MFGSFYNRFLVTADLEAETPLFIGAGQESYTPSAIQGALLKNNVGQPYIPGSSLKGVLRSFLESIPEYNENECHMGRRCSEPFNTGKKRKEYREKIRNSIKADSETQKIDEMMADHIVAHSCFTCRLFGSGVLAGKVKVADAVLNTREIVMTEVRMGNAIDRDTNTAVAGHLFDTETIPAGTVFTLRIMGENFTKHEADVFFKLIQYFADGNILVGGRSRSGLGHICMKNINIQVTKRVDGGFPESKTYEGLQHKDSSLLGQMEMNEQDFAKEPVRSEVDRYAR